MAEQQISLRDAYNRAEYPLSYHGKREVQILKEALEHVDGRMEIDMYGKGPIIENFQKKIATFTGKEDAVFFPSGTMAQQIALRIWCDERNLMKVAYHPLSHLEIHEEDGLKELHRIEPVLIADKDRVVELEDITGLKEAVACVLLELPQREIGGQLPAFETLVRISEHCRDRGIRLHLDGARLPEILPYYGKTAAEICGLFDSVYLSFYKGIGGVAGAVLAGPKEFIAKSKIWKRRHGGDLVSLYPYIIPADYYFERRIGRMHLYYEKAKELAALFNACRNLSTRPLVPVSNMFHVLIPHPKSAAETVLTEVQWETGVGFCGQLNEIEGNGCCFEIHLGDRYAGIPLATVRMAISRLDEKLSALSIHR